MNDNNIEYSFIDRMPDHVQPDVWVANMKSPVYVKYAKLADFINSWRAYQGLPLLTFVIVRDENDNRHK